MASFAMICSIVLVSGGGAKAAGPAQDVALGGTAVASSEYPSASFVASNVNDGDATTRWAGDYTNGRDTTDDWVYVKLAAPSAVYSVVINWQTAYASRYEIQTSMNGTDWTTAATVQNAGAGRVETVLGITDPVSYVKMQGLQHATKYGYSIFSFEVWNQDRSAFSYPDPDPTGWADGSDIARQGTATASSVLPGYEKQFGASQVNDGSSNTRWGADYRTAGHDANTDWVQIELAKPSPVWSVVFNWETARPARYEIQVSDDGQDWTTVQELFDAPVGVDEHKLGLKDPVRFVRMQGLEVATQYGYSLWSFEVWSGPKPPTPSGGTIVPAPVSQTSVDGGAFTLTSSSRIVASDEAAKNVAALLAQSLRPATGYALPIAGGPARAEDIELAIGSAPDAPDDHRALAHDEGYSLTASAKGVRILAASGHGLFNGTQTLLQLLPSWVVSSTARPGPWTIAATNIYDYPRFTERSVLLDPARNFLTVAEVEKAIDSLAMLKANTLHLHLTDNQGWRLAISSRPKLAKVGGAMSIAGGRSGFYTQDDFKQIVAYANARYIDVIPEIEMPSHAGAALASYPKKLGCGGSAGVLCPTSESTFTFIDDVIGEVAALSPSKYIHIGGDESPTLTSTQYDDFIKRVEGIVQAHGKTLEGWNPAPAAGLDSSSVEEFWDDESSSKWTDGVSMAAQPEWFAKGNPVILAPNTNTYVNYAYYKLNTRTTADWVPGASMAWLGLHEQNILGLEAPSWGEQNTLGLQDVEFKTFPRAVSVLDLAWAPATKTENPDTVLDRIKHLGSRWQFAGVNAYADPVVPWTTDMVGSERALPSVNAGRDSVPAAPGGVDGVVATIASPDKPLASFAATIDWGDGSQPTVGTITGTDAQGDLVTTGQYEASHHTGASLFSVSGSHAYAADGTYTGKVTVTTAGGDPRVVPLTVTVGDPGPTVAAPTITSGAPTSAAVGVAYRFSVVATGEPAPTFRVSDGALPTGLSLNRDSGVISGTPAKAGTFTFTITAENGHDPAATAEYTITVAPAASTAESGSGRDDSGALAATGSEITSWFIGALVLLLLGAGLVMRRRRTKRVVS